MPGVLQAATMTALPRGRAIVQKEASGSTILTPRVSRSPLQPRDSSSPLLPGTAPTIVPTGILVPPSPRLLASTSTPANPANPCLGPSQSKTSRLWEPSQSQRQQRAASHLVLGHDANPFQQNGPASSRISPDATAFTDAAPQLYS